MRADTPTSGGTCSCMFAQTGKPGHNRWKSKNMNVCGQCSACRLLMHTYKLKAPLAEERATAPLLLR